MRWSVAAGITLWLTPVLSAGVHAFWPAPVPAAAVGLVLAAVVARLTARSLTETIAPALRSRAIAALVAALAVAAIVQIAMISIYIADPARTRWSHMPSDPFRVRHSCMTAYVEALRFCAQPGTNIYDMSLYEPRTIGPLRVDSFHYPPPFLLLPAAVSAVRADVFGFRALWFVLQCTVLAAAVFGMARWIGGRPGAFAAAGGVLAFATPQFVYSLQQGNVQSTAMPVAAVALVLLWRNRLWAAPLLAYCAAAKIFPGILLVYLAGARRWRALAATAASGLAIVALTLVIFGVRPFEDFVGHELPRISSGEAFPQAEALAVSANLSVYGLTVRLRALGADFLSRPRGLAVASAYGVFVIALAAFAGWRTRPDFAEARGRLRFAQMVLALLLLASFRSPFVGFYGYAAAVWLMTLLAAASPSTTSLVAWWTAIVGFAAAHALLPSPSQVTTPVHLVLSGLLLCGVLALSIAAVRRASRPAPAPAAGAAAGS